MDILKSMTHPEEVYALLHYRLSGHSATSPTPALQMSPELTRCYQLLNQTSRSFSAVIKALEGELRDAVCIFYLVLRALDTVEDDMTICKEEKVTMLREFYLYLEDPEWKYTQSSEKDRIVLEEFPLISGEFRKLKAIYREVIADITKRMGRGMTVYLDKPPTSLGQWDEYCHYVAGLVGIGLSRLFSGSGDEDKVVGQDHKLANSMGLFLQKVNIIRDYLEDVQQKRYFWPSQVCEKYVDEVGGFTRPENSQSGVQCLNELITNALQHIPDVLTYLSRIQTQTIFNFCAIPQVMAIATLERCFNNVEVFRGVVRIRKGEAVKVMMQATNLESVKAIFTHFLLKIQERVPASDSEEHENIVEVMAQCVELCHTEQVYTTTSQRYFPLYVSCAMLCAAILWQYYTGIDGVRQMFSQ